MLLFLAAEDLPGCGKFEALYRRYRGLMYHTAWQVLGSAPDAEDAVQQAFLSILENLDKIGPADSPRTRAFVALVAERKAIDLVRARSRVVPLEEEAPGLTVPPPGDGGLADAMAALPARYREALLLRYDMGYTTGEMAKLLGMRRPAVQKLLWRAREALRELLDKEGEL